MTIFLPVNDVSTTLAASASSTATTLTLSSMANLPASIPSGMVIPFTITTAVTAVNREIVYATAINSSNITVLRAQENTAAQNWNAGDSIFVAVTAGLLQSFANLAGNSSQVFNVAAATAGTEAIPLAQAFQLVQPTASQTISLTALNTLVMPVLTAATTITMAPGASIGQKCRVTGAEYAVTISSNVTTGYPYFAFPDETSAYSWTIPAEQYGAFIDLIWDGANWRAATGGQTVVADAASGNQAVALGQAQANFAAINGSNSEQFNVANATSASEAVPLAQAFQVIGPTASQTIVLSALNTLVLPSVSAAATITLAPGASIGQRCRVTGGEYAVTVASNVSSGSPQFIFPDQTADYSWTISAGQFGAFIDLIWDGVNWRVSTGGQTIVADAAGFNQALALGQAEANFAGINGNSSQVFNVAAATASTEAVNLGQFTSSFASGPGPVITDRPDGTIEQWFIFNATSAGGVQNFTATLPEAFPTDGYMANFCFYNSTLEPATLGWLSLSATEFTFQLASTPSGDFAVAIHVIGH